MQNIILQEISCDVTQGTPFGAGLSVEKAVVKPVSLRRVCDFITHCNCCEPKREDLIAYSRAEEHSRK